MAVTQMRPPAVSNETCLLLLIRIRDCSLRTTTPSGLVESIKTRARTPIITIVTYHIVV